MENKDVLNLLITCGTSQLEREKLLELGVNNADYQNFFEGELAERDGNLSVPHPKYPENDEFACIRKEELVFRLSELINNSTPEALNNQIGKPINLLGAEISTLIQLSRRREAPWVPDRDAITIIASQTYQGQFAASVLQGILEKVWSLRAENLKLEVVPELRDINPKPEVATTNLAEVFSDRLRSQTEHLAWHNILVITGGYKSIIPCATIYSMIFGVELVYIFERSNKLQSLHPWLELDVQKDRDDWKRFLTMIQKNWGERAGGCFREAISKRLEGNNPYAKF